MNALSIAPATPIGAVGAGRMGRGMAIAFAWAGLPVRLIDARPRRGRSEERRDRRPLRATSPGQGENEEAEPCQPAAA